jgi:protein-disulfide isomerase
MSQLFAASRTLLSSVMLLAAVVAYGAPAKPNWPLTFTQSAQGAHIIGNPAAPTKVVEYMSYTCGHCANFETNDAPSFKAQYVATGAASLEIRNFVLNAVDLTAAMLARCGGKGRFFGNHKHLLATQKTWLAGASKISKSTDAKLQAKDYVGYMTGVYAETGLSAIMQRRGITMAQGKACLADKAALKIILDMTEEGSKLGIHATPTFMVNGRVDGEVHDWQSLKTKLPAL